MRLHHCLATQLAAAALLAGCAAGPAIDRSHVAVSQDSRVRYVILHYTHGDLARSLDRKSVV